jgi:hypothetical protein
LEESISVNKEPEHHHFAPQFYLKNFACDAAGKKVMAVAKHGDRAVWQQRSIEYIGAKKVLYYHPTMHSKGYLERIINRDIESPISTSETWDKILNNCEQALDHTDMPVLYALIRNLEFRTPHSLQSMADLVDQCATSPEKFSSEERAMYEELRRNPELQFLMFSKMAGSLDWIWNSYPLAFMTLSRTRVALRTSTTPVHAIKAPDHPGLHLPLPGQTPYMATMSLTKSSFITLVLGNFPGPRFINQEVSDEIAREYNRHRVAQFGHFPTNEHLISDADHLIEDMTWAPFDVESQEANKIVFRRRLENQSAVGR